MSKLLEFLDKLGTDAAYREEYKGRPMETMKQFGLDDAECEMVLKGDVEAVRRLLGSEDVYMSILVHKPEID